MCRLIAGFVAGYGDATRNAYSLDLRRWRGRGTSHVYTATIETRLRALWSTTRPPYEGPGD